MFKKTHKINMNIIVQNWILGLKSASSMHLPKNSLNINLHVLDTQAFFCFLFFQCCIIFIILYFYFVFFVFILFFSD